MSNIDVLHSSKKVFFLLFTNTPKHYIEVWSVDDMAKDASTPFALLALHPTRPTLRHSVSKSFRNVSLSFYSQWYFFRRFWASVMQSESGLATPLFPQSSVKINLTKNPILALDDAEISANLWRRFLLNSSYCKEMTFLCLIEIRFCFNGFAATFVFGGLLIIRLVGEAHTSLLLLLVGYNQLTNEPALLMLLRDGA